MKNYLPPNAAAQESHKTDEVCQKYVNDIGRKSIGCNPLVDEGSNP